MTSAFHDAFTKDGSVELDEPLDPDFTFDTVHDVDCKSDYGSAILMLQLKPEAIPPPPDAGRSPGGVSSVGGSQPQ